jgi:multidrug efflux pump subunit AcrB
VGCFAFGLFDSIFFPNKGAYQPAVVVRASYPGANAQMVADTVAAPIEQQVNGVEGMVNMTSRCTSDGDYELTVIFKPGSDLNLSQVLVQNRVSLAEPVLPDAVKQRGVVIRKKAVGVLLYVAVTGDDRRGEEYLSNLAAVEVEDELARVTGVAEVTPLGRQDHGVRVEPDPEKLAARGLTALDVIKAVKGHKAELEAGAGNLRGESFIQERLGDLVLKADGQDRTIRLRDVAAVEIGALDRRRFARVKGRNVPVLVVGLLPNTKPREVADAVRAKLQTLQAGLPEGIRLEVVMDCTQDLEAKWRPASDLLRLDATLPDSASTERTQEVLQRCEKIIKDVEGEKDVLSLSGPSVGLPENYGSVLAHLSGGTARQRAATLRDRLSAEVPEAVVRVCEPPGGGLPPDGYPMELAVCDRGDTGFQALNELAQRVAGRLAKSGKLTDVYADRLSAGVPTVSVHIDHGKAKALGVPVTDVYRTVQWRLQGETVCEITVHGQPWMVVVAAPSSGSSRAEELQRQMVRGGDGQLVRLGQVAEVANIAAPQYVWRTNLYPMVKITAGLKPGVTKAEARTECERAFAAEAPAAFRLEWLRE